LTKAIAKELRLPMIGLDASDVMRGIVGESEGRQKEITQLLNALAPNILDLEEVEALVPSRAKASDTDSGTSRRQTNGWLDWMSQKERQTIVIANTNFIQDLDPAFYRPQRIDEILPVLPPDLKARIAIFKVHIDVTRKIPVDKDVNTDELGQLTRLWNGSEIEQCCIDASQNGFDENSKTVKMKHFKKAIDEHKISEKLRDKQIDDIVEQLKKTQRYNQTFLVQALEAYRSGEDTKDEQNKISGLIESL
jgi:SpoVK/Ycf46/Vps4 family AAA+-type ATPase